MKNLARSLLGSALCLLITAPSFGQVKGSTEADTDLAVAREAYQFLHTNPELGKQETKAHDYLLAKLKGMGFTQFVTSSSLPTAVIAILDTGRPGATIALRAEMDARPLPDGTQEPSTHTPRSAVPGLMHSCGHDVHAAILLGAASVLKKNANALSGRIIFLFQPAEETPGGADDIVRDGTLQKLGVTKIFAQHSAPGMPVGTVAISPGDTLAGSNYFKLKLTGRSSHAAAPQLGDDVALGAMRVAQEISELPARRLDISSRPVVVSITSFTATSGATNVLPGSAEIQGTIRAYEDPTIAPPGGKALRDIIVARVDAVAASQGLKPEWEEFKVASPPTRNDQQLLGETLPALIAAFPGKIEQTSYRSMYSEDFAFYTAKIKALYFSLGVEKDGLGSGSTHSADFTVHPDALKYGIKLFTSLAEIGTKGGAQQ